jgi:hypothetical protein
MLQRGMFMSTYGRAVAPVYPTDGLIARYAFEDDIKDSGGNGYDLVKVASGTPSYSFSTGVVGKAFKTNKTTWNDSVQQSSVKNGSNSALYTFADGTNQFSVALWVKLTNASADIQNTLNTYQTDYSGAQRFAFPVFGGASFKPPGGVNGCCYSNIGGTTTLISNVDYRDSTWHHFVMTYNGSVTKTYVDNLAASDASRTNPSASGVFILGSAIGSWMLNGELDQIYVYNRALTASEVSQLYNGGSGI